MSNSGDGTGNLVGATPHVKKKHTGRWSNVSMDINNEKKLLEPRGSKEISQSPRRH